MGHLIVKEIFFLAQIDVLYVSVEGVTSCHDAFALS
jgi:hypothetical protein